MRASGFLTTAVKRCAIELSSSSLSALNGGMRARSAPLAAVMVAHAVQPRAAGTRLHEVIANRAAEAYIVGAPRAEHDGGAPLARHGDANNNGGRT